MGWNHADLDDFRKFPSLPIDKSRNPRTFHDISGDFTPELPSGFRNPTKAVSFDDFLSSSKTASFIIIRNDTVIYEKYFDGYSRSSVFPSFSISKSFISALTGIALEEGFIRSIDQPVTDFIPEMKDSAFRHITLENLLSMRSGIKFNEGYHNPFGEMAKFYYGKNLKKYTLKLKAVDDPGKEYRYQSGNAQIMGMVLESATGKNLAEYLSEKIWNPLGMEYDASWSTDNEKNNTIKAFCCINARSLDFAKFGQLYLDNGAWDGQQVVPESWIRETKTVRYPSRDGDGYPYTYFWRYTDAGNLFAKGVMGQYIFVSPGKGVVIVRTGTSYGDVQWPKFFEGLLLQL